MEKYTTDVMKACEITGYAKTPHKSNLFDKDNYDILTGDDKQHYHSTVMKLLYLAKRMRPDILFIRY